MWRFPGSSGGQLAARKRSWLRTGAARFFNEARATNRVAHPGLVQVSDCGQQPDGMPYIVMELLEGESLARRLERRGGKLPSAEVVHLGWQLADSLAAAHAKGIVHREPEILNVPT